MRHAGPDELLSVHERIAANAMILEPNFFAYWERFSLYMLHNRTRETDRVYVWSNGVQYQFTVNDREPTGHDWHCLGLLRWVSHGVGTYFSYHLDPDKFPALEAGLM